MNLKHYSALAAGFLAVKNESDAQIVYTDIKDVTLEDGSYSLDLNNDGIADFRISNVEYTTVYYSPGFTRIGFVTVEPLGYNAVMGSYKQAKALPFGHKINAHSPWSHNKLQLEWHKQVIGCTCLACESCHLETATGAAGNWKKVNDHYLGLKYLSGTDTLYGWARLDVSYSKQNCRFTLKDYAIDTIAGDLVAEEFTAGELDCNSLITSFPQDEIESCDSCFALSVDNPYNCKFTWYENGAELAGDTLPSLNLCSASTYSVKWFVNSLNCFSDTVGINFLSRPVISREGDSLISSQTQLNQWLLNGEPIPGAINQICIPKTFGNYSVEVIGTDGCTLVSAPVIITNASSIADAKKIIVSVLPNQVVQIHFPDENFSNGRIIILNALGQPIKELTVDKNVIKIPFTENQTGWFIINIEKGERKFRSPVIIF